MMKSLLLLVVLFHFSTQAQDTLALTIDNPAPRVGDEVRFTFPFDFFTDEIENQLGDDADFTDAIGHYGLRNNEYSGTVTFKEAGTHTIGPFHFEFNGQKIVTDSVVIDVAKKLPLTEGAWIQVISDQEGNYFLIVEQLIRNEANNTAYTESYSVSEGLDEGDSYAELSEQNFPELNASFSQSKSSTRYDSDQNDPFAPGFTYSFKKYNIHLSDKFSGSFTFRKKYFKNLPQKTHIKNLTITRE